MGYTQTTWTQLQTRFFDRLGDPVFYSNVGPYPEATLYLRESLRVWNSLSNFWRARATFGTTSTSGPWFKLSDTTTNPAGLFTYTMLDQDLVAEMQHQLMEPISPTVWTGTDMFTLSMLTQALQRRRDQFLLETALVLDISLISGAISSEGRMILPQTIVDIRHASWLPVGSTTYSTLWRQDEWGLGAIQPLWPQNPAVPPRGYSLILQPPVSLQILPPPGTGGRVELLSSRSGTALNPATGVLLGVPDDWAWAIKYGALADLLGQEGQARDPYRAAYCEQRWKQATSVATLDPEVLNAQVNGRPIPIVSLQELSANRPSWRTTPGRPNVMALERDMLLLSPVPDAAYGITVDVCIPAPIPVLGTDFINLGTEELDAILDYAHHIASFKEAGLEFSATSRQMDNLIRLASNHNSRLRALSVFKEVFDDRSTRGREREPAVEVSSG